MTAEFIQPDLMPALPEMVMLAMTCLVLVVDLFLPQEKRGFTLLLAVATLVLAIAAVVWVAPMNAVSSFGGSFVLDQLAVVLKISTCVVSILVFIYSRDYLVDHDIYTHVAQRNLDVTLDRDILDLIPVRQADALELDAAVRMLVHWLLVQQSPTQFTAALVYCHADSALMQVRLALGGGRGYAQHAAD